MTSLTAERALELFQHRPAAGNRIDWLANQLLALATECDVLSLWITSAGDEKRVIECSDSSHVVTSSDPGSLRLFRTLLARFAKMAEEESGAPFDPYGGKVHFDRTATAGPVRLTAEFANTTTIQSLILTKTMQQA